MRGYKPYVASFSALALFLVPLLNEDGVLVINIRDSPNFPPNL